MMKFSYIHIIFIDNMSDVDVRHLETFQAIVREGSFGRAARVLGLAQPTVTLHIQELERELGLPLFDRKGRQRQPTAGGQVMARRVLPILNALDALSRSLAELRDGRSGLLRIGAIEPAASQRVTPLLARLQRQRPALRVQLEVGGTAGVSRLVADGSVDIGLCSAPPAELGLDFEPLFEEEMALLLPRSHRLARRRAIAIRDLEGERLLLTEQGCAYRRTVESALQASRVRPNFVLESGSMAALREAVRRGFGVAILPRGAVSPAPTGTVVARLTDAPLTLVVGLARRADGAEPPPALSALVGTIRRELGPRAAPSTQDELKKTSLIR